MARRQERRQQNSKKVLILGGGLAGLSAANKLLDAGFSVTIIEGAPFLGGLASSFYMEGEEIPKFNHHIVRSNIKTIEYLKKYKCMGNNTWTRIRMGFAVDGKLYNINNPFGLMKFKYLSFWGKMRLGLFGLYAIFIMNPDKIDDKLDLDTWLKKYAGKEVKDKIWKNLYGRNKFNISLKQISAKQFAHRLYEKEGYDFFTFPRKGIEKMIDGLAQDVKRKKGSIVYPARIKHVDITHKSVTYQTRKDEDVVEHVQNYDILVNTIPVPELIKFTDGLPKKYVAEIKKLRYVSVVGLCFATEDFLDPHMYWINLFNERTHVIYQHSLIIDKYKSKITWCDRYGGSEEDMGKSDAELQELYLADMRKYFPDMKLKWCKVFREKYAEPIYDKDYVKYAPTYETPIPTLFHAGIQVTFPKIRNMNVALESGEIVAEKVKERFG